MYNKCFQRIEEKYLLSEAQKRDFLACTRNKIVRDKHFRSSMRNVYFDTKDFLLAKRSIEKPIFKHKFRVRSYDDPQKCNEVFLEMKAKYQGVSYKRRIRMSYAKYQKYIKTRELDSDNLIWREIDYYFHYYELCPMLYIAYDRESYAGSRESELRITFDANLRSRQSDLDLVNDDGTQKYFEQKTYIMEIKTALALPIWLIGVLEDLEIRPTSFSKYGQIYQTLAIK